MADDPDEKIFRQMSKIHERFESVEVSREFPLKQGGLYAVFFLTMGLLMIWYGIAFPSLMAYTLGVQLVSFGWTMFLLMPVIVTLIEIRNNSRISAFLSVKHAGNKKYGA